MKNNIKEFLESIEEGPNPLHPDREVTKVFMDNQGVFLPRLEDLLDYIRPISDFDMLIEYRDYLREYFKVEDFLGDNAICNHVTYKTFASQGDSQFYSVNGEQIFNQEPDGSRIYWHFINMGEMLDNGCKVYFK